MGEMGTNVLLNVEQNMNFIPLPLYLFISNHSYSPDKNAIRFIPRENGVHSIDVKFNGSHIPGSPFNVRVGEAGQAGDPGMVTVYGPGLDGGSTGTYTTLYLLIFSLPLYTDPLLLTTHAGEVCHQ